MADHLPREFLEELKKKATPAHVAQYVTRNLPPDTQWRPFDHLMFVNEKIVDACTSPEQTFLNIAISVRHGKSELISRYLPIWYLGMYPDRQVIIVSYNESKAAEWGVFARDIFKEYGPELFGLTVDPDTASKTEWKIKGRRGGLRAVGVNGSLTGIGGDLIIIDDPIKNREEADSATARANMFSWYGSTLRTRLMPHGTMILTMARWHCLLPGSEVEVGDGRLLSVESLGADAVATSNGWARPVAWAERDADEDAVAISCYGLDRPLRVTSDHQILTPDGWRAAGDLRVGDFVVSSASASPPWKMPPPPTRRPLGTSATAGAALPQGVPAWHIAVLRGSGYSDAMIGARYGRSRQWATQLRKRLFGASESRALTMEAEADPDFWWAVGLWVAEGSLTAPRGQSKTVAVWTVGWHERALAERVRSAMERHGLTASILPVKAGGGFQTSRAVSSWTVRVSSAHLASVLTEFGLGASSKKVPVGVEALPSRLVRAFVEGAYAGDGTWQGDWLRYSTRSRSLAFGLRRCLAALGCVPTVMRSGDAWEVRVKVWDLDGRPIGRSQTLNVGGDLHHKVKSIERFHYTGPVYDLTTTCGDFRAEGITVHNCDDLTGMIQRTQAEQEGGDPWEEIRLPAIAEAPKPPDGAPDDWLENWRDVMGRRPGEALWPEVWPEKKLLQIKASILGSDWDSLYQQNPTPAEGGMFKVDSWRTAPAAPPGLRLCRAWDLAATDGAGDWTVGALVGMDADNRVYVLDIQRFQLEAAAVKREVLRVAKADGKLVPIRIEQERAGAGKAQVSDFKRLLIGYDVRGRKPEGTKEQRAAPYAAQQQDGNVILVNSGTWGPKFIEEHRVFPKGRHDDQVDAVSSAFDELVQVVPVTITAQEDVSTVTLDALLDNGFGRSRTFTIPVG